MKKTDAVSAAILDYFQCGGIPVTGRELIAIILQTGVLKSTDKDNDRLRILVKANNLVQSGAIDRNRVTRQFRGMQVVENER